MASALKDKVTSAASSAFSENPDKANTDSSGNDKRANYRLRLTAGPNYDKSLQTLLHVNSTHGHPVSQSTSVSVRIRDYTGLPSAAPKNVPEYFDRPEHSKDTFSVAWAFTPPRDLPASDLFFGIDTGHNPLRKFGLPKSLVNTAFKIVKEFIDPSLACDAGVDEPWVRGPAVAGATTTFCVGDRGDVSGSPAVGGNSTSPASEAGQGTAGNERTQRLSVDQSDRPRNSVSSSRSASISQNQEDLSGVPFPDPRVLAEGAVNASAAEYRKEKGLPSDAGKRRKYLLNEAKRKDFILEKGRTYYFDFSNGYIDWANYTLKLPGFNFPVLKYIGGGKPPPDASNQAQPHDAQAESNGGDASRQGSTASQGGKGGSGSHKVRFFLKDLKTDEMFFVIMCTLLTGEDLTAALEEDRRTQGQ